MSAYIYIYTHTQPVINSTSDVFHTGMLYVDVAHTEVQLKVSPGWLCQSDSCQMTQLKTIGLRLFQTYLNLIPDFRQMLS